MCFDVNVWGGAKSIGQSSSWHGDFMYFQLSSKNIECLASQSEREKYSDNSKFSYLTIVMYTYPGKQYKSINNILHIPLF